MNFEEVQKRARAFRDEREWAQFHNPKDVAIALSVEASELLDTFRWTGKDVSVGGHLKATAEELADVAIYCFYLADALNINLAEEICLKLEQNAKKYPVEKAKGNARKYSQL